MSEQISNPTPLVPAVFQFEGHEVRTIEIEGSPWFVAKDVADVLGYVNQQKAIRMHCKHAKPVGVTNSVTLHDLNPQTVIIKKNDIYRLIVRSEMPIADKFESWLFDEVLPAIEKHGHYSVAPAQHLPATRDPFQTLQLHYDVLAKHDSDIKSLTSRTDQVEDIALDTAAKVEYIENSRGLEPWQAYAIKQEMGTKVYELHEKYGINRGMLFSASWGFLKRYFKVPTYSAISCKRFEEALMVVKNLTLEQLPPTIIELAKGTKRTAKAEKGGN